jgi:hypothetical protein
LREQLNQDETLPRTIEDMERSINNKGEEWTNYSTLSIGGQTPDKYHQYSYADDTFDTNANRNVKYGNIAGQEAVYDSHFNKGNIIDSIAIQNEQDPYIKALYINAKGTYNYVTPILYNQRTLDILEYITFIGTGVGHILLDVIPWKLGGNVRGTDPKPEPTAIDR